MTTDERLASLEKTMQEAADHNWRTQGRLNALELVATAGTLNFAKLQHNPFQWIQDYIESMRQASKTMVPDVNEQSKGDRLLRETRDAIDEILQQLVQQAGQLKGAPGSR